jgi:hypothetical protein
MTSTHTHRPITASTTALSHSSRDEISAHSSGEMGSPPDPDVADSDVPEFVIAVLPLSAEAAVSDASSSAVASSEESSSLTQLLMMKPAQSQALIQGSRVII